MTAPTLHDLGELGAIERLRRFLPSREDVVAGIGDDCAVVRPRGGPAADDWLLTSDPVIEGVHFKPGTPAHAVGHKAMGRVLSDIAAMGGRPLWSLVDVVAPAAAPARLVDELYEGIQALCKTCGMLVVGGDMASGPCFEVHVFGVGAVPRDRALLRSGARPGDWLGVTGSLGGSLLGRHLEFTPRLTEGAVLREWATACIDLSDGLASDLRHLLRESRVGAQLRLADIPVSDAARRMPGGDALHHALCDGEDFELLFTVPADRLDALTAAWHEARTEPFTLIGRITEHPDAIEGVDRNGQAHKLSDKGFQHFV